MPAAQDRQRRIIGQDRDWRPFFQISMRITETRKPNCSGINRRHRPSDVTPVPLRRHRLASTRRKGRDGHISQPLAFIVQPKNTTAKLAEPVQFDLAIGTRSSSLVKRASSRSACLTKPNSPLILATKASAAPAQTTLEIEIWQNYPNQPERP